VLRSLFLWVLIVAEGATVGARANGPGSVEGDGAPRLLFGGPVEDEVLWDEQHLWLVSRGGLYEIDACREAPRRVELPRGVPPERRRKSRDPEDELILAALDDADWDDAVLEDFRDQEGLPPEETVRRQRTVPFPSLGPPIVLALSRKGEGLDVATAEGVWTCQPERAFCRAPGSPGRRSASFEVARDAKIPPERREDRFLRWETTWGVWFVNGQGVWFDAGELAQAACAPFRELDGGAPFVRPPPPPLAQTMWLPRVSLLGARELRRTGGSTHAETAVILLLTFSAPRVRAVGDGADFPGRP